MNGKNRRVSGCWARGKPRYSVKNSRRSIRRPDPNTYSLPVFSSTLKDKINNEQRALLHYFETFPYVTKMEEYSYNANTTGALVKIRNSHFMNGTLRITKPGIYILQENILFGPNEQNDFMPNGGDIASGKYPVGADGAYHLGFFAGITIETTGVILDLNSFTIQQTKLHNIQQRFYANIELASAPFIAKQGPGSFSTNDTYRAANKVLIRNGTLGVSSHHGIHGNGMKNVVIDGLTIEQFEVAGIALNGTQTGIIHNTIMKNVAQNIPILSTYSQSRFIRSFLSKVPSGATLEIEGATKTKETIMDELNNALATTKNEIMTNKEISNTLFNNTTKLYDGNVYGMVLHAKGVVVNGFVRDRNTAVGNTNIHLQDIVISNIVSHPIEIIGLSNLNAVCDTCVAYGVASQAGPVGGIFLIEQATNATNKTYKPNVLSNAQLLIAKNNEPKKGTTSLAKDTVDWVEMQTNLDTVMSDNGYYYVNGQDSMGHTMKGNIGLFISAAESITGHNINVTSVHNKGHSVGTSPLISFGSQKFQGASSVGILFTGSKDVAFTNSAIHDSQIVSDSSNHGLVNHHSLYAISSANISHNGVNKTNDEE